MPNDNYCTLRNGTKVKQNPETNRATKRRVTVNAAETTNGRKPKLKKPKINIKSANTPKTENDTLMEGADKTKYKTGIINHTVTCNAKPDSKGCRDDTKWKTYGVNEPILIENQSIADTCKKESSEINDVLITRIKAHKLGSYYVKVADDKEEFCAIQGISIAPDGRRLLVDSLNRKIKMFSRDMEFLDCIKTWGRPLDVACINNEEAAVITLQKSLVILDISNGQMSIKSANAILQIGLWNIARCKNNIAVTYPFHKGRYSYAYVKLVDRRGKVIWVGCKELQKQGLLSNPASVSCFDEAETPIVFVSDSHMNKLISMNGNTGDYINEKDMLGPGCLTSTQFGIVCVSSKGVSLLWNDFSQERVLLSVPEDLEWGPLAMAYDCSAQQLVLSYTGHVGNAYHGSYIDCFQLYL